MNEEKNSNDNLQMNEEEQKKKRKKILIFLFIIALITTVAVSFILQNNTSKPPTIENIPINPVATRNVHVSGQVVYENGKPFQNGKVELHSEVMKTTTDQKGWFLFENVVPENHELQVLDGKGKVLANAQIDLRQSSTNSQIDITKSKDGNYIVNISEKIRYLELSVTIKEGVLLLDNEKTYTIDDDGKVYTVNGEMTVDDGAIILESGTIITEGNMIIHFPYGIDEENNIISIGKDGTILPDGSVVDGEGKVTLPSGVVIDPEKGTVTRPDTSTGDVEDNRTEQIPEDTPSHVDPEGNVEPIKPEPENPDNPVNPDNPDIPDVPDYAGASVVGKDRLSWSNPWTLNTPIDLFYTGGKEETPVIKPGSTGYYLFKVENNREKDLKLNILLNEINVYDSKNNPTTHLPFRYRLGQIKTSTDELSGNVSWNDWNKTIDSSGKPQYSLTLTSSDVVSGKSSDKNYILYRLEWEWPFESGNDEADTISGKNQIQYQVNLNIKLEE